MTYQPREFWEQRLREQFDLRGTGETGLSLEYNRACYTLRREVLERALRAQNVKLDGASVLDVGCGTGFFTQFYLEHGARVTGIDLTTASVERLATRFPQARFVQADVGVQPIEGRYDVVNAFDVLYHITDDVQWERAVRHLSQAVAPHGVLLLTDRFAKFQKIEAHNVARMLDRYQGVIAEEGLEVIGLYETHVLLNRELGIFRFLNRFPGLLLFLDRQVLSMRRRPADSDANTLLIARRV